MEDPYEDSVIIVDPDSSTATTHDPDYIAPNSKPAPKTNAKERKKKKTRKKVPKKKHFDDEDDDDDDLETPSSTSASNDERYLATTGSSNSRSPSKRNQPPRRARSKANQLIAENSASDDEDGDLLLTDEYVPADGGEARRMCVACFTRPCRNSESVFCSEKCVRSVADEVAVAGGSGKKKKRPRASECATEGLAEEAAAADPDSLLLLVASPIPREILLQRDEYFLSSDADYVAPLSVLITFLVKARKGEIPVRYKTVPTGDVVGGLIYVYRSFEFREGRNEVHWSQDGFVLSQCNRRNHPVADSDGLQVVEDLCETPPSPDGDPVAALFRRKAVWTTLDPNLVVIQYVGDISTAVSGLNNFVSCDVVQDSSEIVIDETPKKEMVEMETEANVTTPDVSTEVAVEMNPEIGDLSRNSNEARETHNSEEGQEVVDLSEDEDEMACQPKAQPVPENVVGNDVSSNRRRRRSSDLWTCWPSPPRVPTPDVSNEEAVERNPEIGLSRNSNEDRENHTSEEGPEVVDLWEDDDEMACKPIAQQVPERDSGKNKAVQIKPLPKLPAGLQVIRSVDLLDEPPERRPPPPLIEINPRTPKKRLPSVSAPSTCSREDILKKLPKSTNILASPSLSKRFDSLVMGHPQQSPSPGKNKDPSRGKISLLPCGPPTKVAEVVDLSEDEGGGDEDVAVLPAPPPLLRIGQAVTLPESGSQEPAPPPPSSLGFAQQVDPSSQFSTPQKRPSTSSEASPSSSAKKCRTKVTPKRNLSEMPLKQYQYKQSQYWDSQQSQHSRTQQSQHRQIQVTRPQVPQTPNIPQEIQNDQVEDVIEILDDENEDDIVREAPERIKKKKVIQVKVEDESEVSALKTLGFRVCS